MNETTVKLIEKAQRSIAACEGALRDGHVENAAGRAYYAMFYATEALLNERGLRFRKHGGVHAAFGQHFAKTGLMDARYHRWLLAAFNKRIVADYGVDVELGAGEVGNMLGQACEFVGAVRSLLKANP